MALIYKITNKKNNKIYIGKTIRSFEDRLAEHFKDAVEEYSNNICKEGSLHKDLIEFGKDNFIYEILETNILESNIDEKEKYYIQKYDSFYSGYNQTKGGDGGRTSSVLTEDQVLQIKEELQNINNLESLSSIAKRYNVDSTTIININNGKSWFEEKINYPIRKYDVTGLTISKEKYKNIIKDLQNNSLLLKEIRQKYDLSEEQMTSINQGKHCYNGKHNYYKDVYAGPFPVKKNNQQKIKDIKDFIPILHDVIFTDLSMAKIGEKYNVQGNTISYICRGDRRKELTANFILPIKKNIEENKKIFLSLYPNYKDNKGGD